MKKPFITLSSEILDSFEEDFIKKSSNRIAMNAVTNSGIVNVAVSREKIHNYPLSFSTELKTPEITDQKSSGRCWIFAALNKLRIEAFKKMKIENLEFSQSYLMFYDKIEKSNYFLESIIKTMNKNINSRLLSWILDHCMEDGGQWSMFTSLINKYGLVPKEIYPESISSSATLIMNEHISEKLREYAKVLRAKKTINHNRIRDLKNSMMNEIYKIMAIHNGIPPKKFDWTHIDKSKNLYYSEKKITPVLFKKKYLNFDASSYVSLINCPVFEKPFLKHYTVNFLGNVVGGDPISYINVKIEIIRKAVVKTIKNGTAVWFGCDVGKYLSIKKGIIDTEIFNFEDLYGVDFSMDKGDSVNYLSSKMTHAMLITGFHEGNDGDILRWKVENSWGKKGEKKGFLVMGNEWFKKYVFQVVVPKKYVEIENLEEIINSEPIALDP